MEAKQQTTRYVLVKGHSTTGNDGSKVIVRKQDPRVVAVSSGIRPLELSMLLTSVFPDDNCGEPVGLEDDFGNVIALSVACRNPETLSAPSYTVLRLSLPVRSDEQEQLYRVISKLQNITTEQSALLRSLAYANHDLVMQPLARFQETGNYALFELSLLSVARFVSKRLELAQHIPSSHASSHTEVEEKLPEVTGTNSQPPNGMIRNSYALTRSEMVTMMAMVRELVLERRITLAGGRSLKRLILQSADCIRAVYEVYVHNGDKEDLKETLCHIVQIFIEDTQLQVANEAAATVTEEGGPFPLKEVTEILDSFQEECGPVDMLVLRLLTEKSHPVMHAAFLAYIPKNDRQDLLDTLERIVRRFSIDLVLVHLLESDLVTMQNAQYLRSLFLNQNPVILGAWDMFVDSGAGQQAMAEFGDTLRRIVWRKSDIAHATLAKGAAVVVRTIERLADAKLINPKETRVLEALARSHDQQLMNTLQEFAKHKNRDVLVRTLRTTCITSFTAKKELLDLVVALRNDDRLTPHQYIMLRYLILNGEESVYAAHAVYLSSQDVSDLIDTLLHVANMHLAPVSKRTNQTEGNTTTQQQNNGTSMKDDVWKFLLGLVQVGKLRTNEFAYLAALANDGDKRIADAFNRYAESLDTVPLVNTLKEMAQGAHQMNPTDSLPGGGGADDDGNGGDLSQRIASIISDLGLQAHHVQALQTAVANSDPVVMAAVQLYQTNNDAEELRETLRIVAESETGSQASRLGDENEQLKVLLVDVMARMTTEGSLLDQEDAETLLRLFAEQDSLIISALQLYATDKNYDEVSDIMSRVLAREDSMNDSS